MIKVLFCTQPKMIGSLLISWGTKDSGQKIKDTPSHVAFLFFGYIVFDSTLIKGVHESELADFRKTYTILDEVDLEIGKEEEFRYFEAARKLKGARYDWLAILYFSWRVLLKKFFNIPIPQKNKLAVPSMHFCTEVYQIIKKGDYGMVSPNDLYKELKENGYSS